MKQIRTLFQTLHEAWGPQHWWPAESPFEVIVGAILTQNTAWTNVERALANLRSGGKLSLEGIRGVPISVLEELIRPAGYFRQKSARVKTFVAFLDNTYDGSLEAMFVEPTAKLRAELLSLNGIGPETADSILLYAGNHEVFVVDAYTRRIFERHGLAINKTPYDDIRKMVEHALRSEPVLVPHESRCENGRNQRPIAHAPSAVSSAPRTPLAQRFNEFHGLIVQVGKHFCTKTNPKCELCPLVNFLQRPSPSCGRVAKSPRTKPARTKR